MAFLTQNKASFCKNCDHNIGFWKKTPIFSPKMGKNRRKLWSPLELFFGFFPRKSPRKFFSSQNVEEIGIFRWRNNSWTLLSDFF
jgi:hypothetical protein